MNVARILCVDLFAVVHNFFGI